MKVQLAYRTAIAAAAIIAMAALAATPVDAATAINTGNVVASIMVPLSGDVQLPPNPCVPNGEDVQITGQVHVVSVFHPDFSTELHLNMAAVLGTGATGDTYIGTGAIDIATPSGLPPNPCSGAFTLQTTNGCAAQPLSVAFTLYTDDTGQSVASGSATVITSCSG